MQKHRDDESVDRVLRQVLPELMTTAGSGACIDAETFAAWTAGTLPASQGTLVEAHVSHCARCQQLMAAFVRTEAAVPMPAPSVWQRWRLHRVVPLAAATAILAIWLALPGSPTDPPAAQEVATSIAENKPAVAPEAPTDLNAPNAAAPRAEQQRDDANAPAGSLAARARIVDRAASTGAPPAELLRRDQAVGSVAAAAEGTAPAAAAPAATLAQSARVMQERAAPMIEIVSPDPTSRWRIVAGGRVERSTTAGSTWDVAVVNAPAVLTAGASPGPAVCWLVGRGGAIRLTTDGTRFDSIIFPESVDLVSVRATNATSAIVTTADGRAFRTDDRGTTWVLMQP